MSSEDAASRQDRPPLGDAPGEQTAASTDAYDAFGADLWEGAFADPFADPTANLFSAEIENVNASDWDIDAARIWGDDGEQGVDGGGVGLDLPL